MKNSGDRWVKIPEGAQITMSRDAAHKGVSLRDKVIIGGVIAGVLWLYSGTHDDSTTDNKPTRPGPSATAPAKAGE